MTSTAETLRRDLHASTAQVSSLLTRYAKLAAQASTSYSSSGILKDDVGRRKDELEGELDGALESFSGQIERLQTFQSTAHPPPSTSAVHALERHREVLLEYRRDYSRTQVSLKEAQQRANLLGSVRDEISAFKSSTTSSVTDQLLSERSRIDSSHSMTDQVLGQAYETRAEFARQRSGLQGINSRMNGVISQVPALNSLLGMINTRRRRDSLIVGGVIAVCTIILCYFFIL